ncbi:MAG: hypothetical protein WBA89_30640 [Microcoleus sp.]
MGRELGKTINYVTVRSAEEIPHCEPKEEMALFNWDLLALFLFK